jgi:nucleotide-binding universal stress UspA family protein
MSATPPPIGVVLISYDESDDARAAIAAASPLIAGRDVIVAYFWQPFAEVARSFAINLLEIVQDPAAINAREQARAEAAAAEGAELARAHGITCEGRARTASGPLDEAIIAYADELDAGLIVLGARGRSSWGSALLGNVAHDVLQRARMPVLVVPSPALSERRSMQP